MTVERVRVGEVLELDRVPIEPQATERYVTIGVRSFGKGIFHYEEKRGDQLGKLRFFELKPRRLVVSNIKGWEGAVAVSTAADEGCIASNRFLTYRPVDDRIDIDWAKWFFLSKAGLPLIQRASPGSADRNRTLAIERFENLLIPLPSLDDQQATAKRLDRVREAGTAVAARASRSAALVEAGRDSLVEAFLASGVAAGWPVRLLSEVAAINPRPVRLQPGDPVAFVPMAAVDATTGTVADADNRTAGDIGAGYKQFAVGDVIFARITPCMQNGKCAIFEGPQPVGYGSTEFHVIRASREVSARWLHRVMRSVGFRQKAAERFKGTAGQQRVPADFLDTVLIPVPLRSDQDEAIAELDRIEQYGLQLVRSRARADRLISSLEASAMNREFAGIT